ncbi:MAG: UDP-N-acetylglucosamine 2-epimerase (non-hydrolyzing) [Candidatus Omnitrophica bacterium]|nr:UDP-N-acetylglucosamine 2-epimerase (non-hydrolyzing) [Candidatus Omnitrophota bacterium]
MKVLSIVGARPQFIKVKPVIESFRRNRIQHILLHTGQHYDYEMSKIFFQQLNIPKPDYHLNVKGQTSTQQTALILQGLEGILKKERPDMVLVYGDTTSTMAGALASVHQKIPLGHVEAGLRSYRLDMPEEVNRVLTDHMSNLLFCPTKAAVDNLKREGITKNVFFVGDVMYDVFKQNISVGHSNILKKNGVKPKGYYLLTIHRQDNADNIENLKSILLALGKIKDSVVFPVHPRTQKMLKTLKDFKPENLPNILFISPVGYLDMLILEKNAKKILTDSGGVQKEAYFLNVPCITLRNETEWKETLNDGCNTLAGVSQEKILKAIKKTAPRKKPKSFFGDGRAAEEMVEVLKKILG